MGGPDVGLAATVAVKATESPTVGVGFEVVSAVDVLIGVAFSTTAALVDGALFVSPKYVAVT
jgi:hypothetical protein